MQHLARWPPFFYWFLESWCQLQLENAVYSKFYLIIFEYCEFFTDLPITESAILSTPRKFEDCLRVEGWLKTGNKSHYFQAWFSLEVGANFFSSFVDQRLGWAPFYQGCYHGKLLISAAKLTQLWLGIVQHLARWPPFFIAYLQSTCLRDYLFKIWEKSIWYFYHARATLKWVVLRLYLEDDER